MMIRKLKYLIVFLIPLSAWLSLNRHGIGSYELLIFAFGIVPFLELFIKPDASNLSGGEEALVAKDKFYDFLVYSIVPVHYFFLGYFLYRIEQPGLSVVDKVGYVITMGLLNGIFGINVAHELGHRVQPHERFLAKMLLLSTLYMHFYIEHNRGHHKRVATAEDPASSRLNETVYAFWVRSIIHSYLSAWNIQLQLLKNKNLPFFSWQNEMLRFQILQIALVATVAYLTSWEITLYFIIACIIGWLLLETVNYIEHYGLQRNKINGNTYERVMPHHSWNSNHILGRLFLFELSRHSDHHYKASRKYQILAHHEHSPQMPTGYPGMMLLSLIPPLWFYIMNKKIQQFSNIASSPSSSPV